MSRRRKRGSEEDKADIDLTPMLDVVFIMLIFFIVTASFVREIAIDTNIPEHQDNPPPPPEDENPNILLEVDANNEILIEKRRVDIRSVRSLIEQKRAENPEASVIVKAHAKSEAGTYVAIADAARQAKVYQVSLVPEGVDR